MSLCLNLSPTDIKPSAVHVGNIVQGARMAWAQGRDLGISDDESDSRKHQFLTEILRWRAGTTPDHVLFTLLNARVSTDLSDLLFITRLYPIWGENQFKSV